MGDRSGLRRTAAIVWAPAVSALSGQCQSFRLLAYFGHAVAACRPLARASPGQRPLH